MFLEMSKQKEIISELVIDKYLENPDISYAELGKKSHVSRATARNIVLKFKRDKSASQKKGAGRKFGG